jgi:hypothetical protein
MADLPVRGLTAQVAIERTYGVRFTELLRLPYFDTVRFTTIDLMHNILLGSATKNLGLFKDGETECI